ncbi:hypothetical protein V6Z11_D12G149900 [Gossypium hirsutum]
MKGKTYLEVGANGVAIITINNPPHNLLPVDVLLSLKDNTEQALLRDDVNAVVITGSKGKFSGGFDVTAFGKKGKHGKLGFWSIEFVTDILEGTFVLFCYIVLSSVRFFFWSFITSFYVGFLAARKPFVAAIDGPALGGGLEIALACHARISTSSAVLGLPELRYGILPGLGGTQRLPRLVGFRKALEMILMSKLVYGDNARGMDLVDGISSADLLTTTAYWLEPLPKAKMMLEHARVKSKKQAPNLKHPLVCIDVIEEGLVHGPRAALWKESKALHELRQSDTCSSLVYFFARQRTSKVPGITDMRLIPRKVDTFAVVGGGILGSSIATALILSNYSVILKELDEKALLTGIERVKVNLQDHVKQGKLAEVKLDKILSLCKGVLHYEGFREVDMVIEVCSTSMINLNLINERRNFQNRIVGTHFFGQAHLVPVLEIIRTEKTSPQVIVDLLAIRKKMRKTPVVVHNSSAMMLVEHGVDLYQIDQAVAAFGMTMGPFRMMDFDGFDVASAMKLIFVMQEDIQADETTRKGFYIYDGESKFTPNPDIKMYVNKARSISGLSIDYELMQLSDEEIVEMILFPVVNEACCVLEDKIVVKASDLDVASVTGMGFPEYRGGIIFWADTLGPKYICSKLEKWSKTYGPFKPCAYLEEKAFKRVSLVSY